MNRLTLILLASAVLLAGLASLALFPVKIVCGAPGMACMPAPDARGMVRVRYEVEPAGIALLESVFEFNAPFYYWDGRDEYKLSDWNNRP